MKTCGPTRIEASLPKRADLPVEDTTCPTGWSCSATSLMTYKDERGREQPAFGGFADQPVCVPDGWKPER